MKVLIPIILLALITLSGNQKFWELENRISVVETQNKILSDSVLYIQSNFIKPMKVYERIVFEEITRSPEETISEYRRLINMYPNTMWEDEAKKRIERVQVKVRYWENLEGWNLPMEKYKPRSIETIDNASTIICYDC